LSSYGLAVFISFGEMLDTFGDDFIVVGWTSHRVLGAGYAIFYPQLRGYFIVFTDCEDPQIAVTTTVVDYIYTDVIWIEIHSENQFSIWNGYDTVFPDCSTFPAG
jgi:hypothetical protein